MSKPSLKIFIFALFTSIFVFGIVYVYESTNESPRELKKVEVSKNSLVKARVIKTYTKKAKEDPEYSYILSGLNLDSLVCEINESSYICLITSKEGELYKWDSAEGAFLLKAGM